MDEVFHVLNHLLYLKILFVFFCWRTSLVSAFSLLEKSLTLQLFRWLLTNSSNLANYLLKSKQHHLLTCYSHMTNHKSCKFVVWYYIFKLSYSRWNFIFVLIFQSGSSLLVQSYLETNEPYKAADLVAKISDTPEAYLKVKIVNKFKFLEPYVISFFQFWNWFLLLQMIKLFEHADQSDIIVHLAELAINIAEKTSHPDLVSTWNRALLFIPKLQFYPLIF